MKMTKEEKQLLLIDLCARLPYGVKIATSLYQYGDVSTIKGIVGEKCYFNDNPRYDGDCPIEEAKPYLRPMSNMTEEEKEVVCSMNVISETELNDRLKYQRMYVQNYTIETFDYFNERKLDYRGLIPMGLALEAKEEMYKTE